jgi:putative membrane protein
VVCRQAAASIRESPDVAASDQGDSAGMYYSDHMNGPDWAAMGLMMVFMVLLVVVVIWAITQWTRPVDRSTAAPSEKSPSDILDERFARGEIDQDEYQNRRRALGDHLPAH